MNKEIENIIKNLPKYKNGSKAIPKDDIVVQYSALSLITDEVIKVVVEKIKEMKMDSFNYDFEQGYNQAIGNIIYKLTNSSTLEGEQSEYLSPNKENKNNDGRI